MLDSTHDSPKKAVLVTDRYWPAIGGVEHWAHAVSLLLPENFNVRVIALANDSCTGIFPDLTGSPRGFQPYRDEAGHQVFPLEPLPSSRLALSFQIIRHAPFIRRLFPHMMFDFLYRFFRIVYFKPLCGLLSGADVVHCFSTGLLAACVTDVCQKQEIALIHAPSVHFGKWGDSPLLLRSYSQAAVLISQTELAREEFRKHLPLPQPRIRLNTPPLLPEPPEESPVKSISEPFVLFLGRRERHKGLHLLLSAFELLAAQATLVVAGPGGPLLSPATPVVDLGTVSDGIKQWLLSHCSVFCVPSLDESFGIVYLEAMRCAKPVVALDVFPVNEIVENNETGILCPPGSPGALASALDRLLCDEKLRGRMSANAKKRYETRFAAEKIITALVEMYEQAISGKAADVS